MKRCLKCEHEFESDDWACPSCKTTPRSPSGFLEFAPDLSLANDGFDKDSFSSLFNIEAGNFWFRNRNKLIAWAFGKTFPKATNFLEIGCGTGFVLSGLAKHYPQTSFYGSEIHTTGLSFAKKRNPNATLFQMDGRAIPFCKEFQVIGAFDVLEHIDQDQEVLKEIFKALTPGGGMILTVPQHPWLWSDADDIAFHKRRYTRKELISKVTEAGFKITRCTSFVSFLLPLMALSRKKSGKKDPGAEFQLSKPLNKILEIILFVEQIGIRFGLSYPLGGSLLLTAQKEHHENTL